MVEIRNFHHKFYTTKDKVVQDNFILQYCKVAPVKRRRPRNSLHSVKNSQGKFFVLSLQKKLIPVCKNTFMGILGITRRRVDTVLNNFFKTSVPAKENRGGDRKSRLYSERKMSVMNFINKFKAVESHYCRGQSERLYLDSNLSIKKMWKMYQNEHPHLPVKESFFRGIFNTCYNLSFKTPRTDVCSACLQYQEKIKNCKDDEAKSKLVAEKTLHKTKAKAYFKFLRDEEEGLVIFSFDCQKNQVLPKVPDQESYYSRQVYIYNFSVVMGTSKSKLNPSKVHCFTWTENEFGKGSNEISSCLFHILNATDFTGVHTIRLMCDGCGGQNKNTTLIGMCMYWLGNQTTVSRIEVIFPIRGHSFIPPDRVFGNIEKEIRKREIILQPEEYLGIFSQFGTVLRVGNDVVVYDWKTELGNVMKPPGAWHFSFLKAKRMIIKRQKGGSVTIQGEVAYNLDVGMSRTVNKKAKSLSNLKPAVISKQNILKQKKKADVKSLIAAHYGDDWIENTDLSFYKYVLEEAQDLEEDTAPENLCENYDDGPDVAV